MRGARNLIAGRGPTAGGAIPAAAALPRPAFGVFLAVVLSLVFVAIVWTAVQSYRAVDRELTSAALSGRAAVAQLAAATLAEKFDHLADVTVSLATRVRFRQLVAAGEWDEAIKILRDVPRDFPLVDRLVLFDSAGTLMADLPEQPEVRGKNFAYRDWYQGVARDWKPYISSVYRRAAAPQSNVFAVAVPVRKEGGAPAGILLLQTRLDAYFEWARAVEVGPAGFVYVVDRTGQTAFHPAYPAQGEIANLAAVPVVRKVLRAERGVEIAFDPAAKEDAVSAYAPVANYGWGVVVRQPERAAFAARNQQVERLLTAYGLTLLFFVVGIYLTARVLSQRRQAVQELRAKAELERAVAERTDELADANRVLRENEARFRAVTDTASDAIVSADERGHVVYFNKAAERMFGYGAAEVLDRPLTLLMPERYRDAHRAGIERYLATSEAKVVGQSVELAGLRKGGEEFPVELSLSSWTAGGAVFFAGILRDLTERKRFEHALQDSNRELESFCYSVSHDLRTPLRAVDGFSRILEEDHAGRLDEEARRVLGVIRGNTRKMGQLIDDLLEFSRIGRRPLSISPIDMNRLVREVVQELQGTFERRPQFELGTLPLVHGDESVMRQVWTNLLANAVKFSSKREQPVVEVSGHENGAFCEYRVKDNGAGFDMRYYDKLFGVFQRLHAADEFPGTGVGLAIVQRVVARHGGRVWAEGKVDGGAAFYFSLPKGGPDGGI